MKELKVGIWDRIMLTNILLGGSSDAEGLRKTFKILDAGIEIGEKEAKEIKLREDKGLVVWDDKKVFIKLVKLEDAEFDYLREVLNNKTDWPKDRRVVELLDKVNT